MLVLGRTKADGHKLISERKNYKSLVQKTITIVWVGNSNYKKMWYFMTNQKYDMKSLKPFPREASLYFY